MVLERCLKSNLNVTSDLETVMYGSMEDHRMRQGTKLSIWVERVPAQTESLNASG